MQTFLGFLGASGMPLGCGFFTQEYIDALKGVFGLALVLLLACTAHYVAHVANCSIVYLPLCSMWMVPLLPCA